MGTVDGAGLSSPTVGLSFPTAQPASGGEATSGTASFWGRLGNGLGEALGLSKSSRSSFFRNGRRIRPMIEFSFAATRDSLSDRLIAS